MADVAWSLARVPPSKEACVQSPLVKGLLPLPQNSAVLLFWVQQLSELSSRSPLGIVLPAGAAYSISWVCSPPTVRRNS